MTIEEAINEQIAFQKAYNLVIPGKIWTQAEIKREEYKRLKGIEILGRIKEAVENDT